MAPLLLQHEWAPTMAVTVDAETASDAAALPVTVLDGNQRARPDLQHRFGEADAAMWHVLRVGGVGGVVLSADADGIDWGLRTLLLHPPDARPQYILQFLNAGARTVSINRLLEALERGGPTTLRNLAVPGLPVAWTPIQRVVCFLLVKALGGNDYHEATLPTPDSVVVSVFKFAATMPALCDERGDVNINAVVVMALRQFYEDSPMRKNGLPFPVVDLAAPNALELLARAHAFVREEIADLYKQPVRGPPAYGQVPSLRALELSAARARTYIQYVASIATPLEPFTGWTAPGSGFAKVDDTLLLHWDDKDGAPLLGPASLVAATAAKRPLSAVATPTNAGSATGAGPPKRRRQLPQMYRSGDYDLSTGGRRPPQEPSS